MAARAKKTDTPATEKAAPKKRAPKPVTDLATATTALKAAQRRADRAEKAYDEARTENYNAQSDLEAAKAVVKKFYAELMGEQVDDAPAGLTDADDAYAEGEGDDHGDHSDYVNQPSA